VNEDISFSEPRRRFVTQDADLLEAGPSFEPYGVGFNPAQRGYTIVHNYAHCFWRPYLGNTAFALWELLLSFCYGDCDTAYPSISRLARMLTNSDHSRAVVMGRHSAKAAASDGAASKRRCTGALDVLRRERLVQVMQRGHGPTTHYTFRLLQSLPLLRPEQVARLSPSLQRDHARWLERYAIDTQAYHDAYTSGGPQPSGADPDLTPMDSDNSRDAPRSTNHTQEKDLMKYWWQEMVDELRLQLTRAMFDNCLLGTGACAFQDGVLTVQAPSEWAGQMLERMSLSIQRSLRAISQDRVQGVRFIARRSGEGTECAP
jgi:hypothetical protein